MYPDDVILAIRRRTDAGEPTRAIAADVGVSHSLVHAVATGARRTVAEMGIGRTRQAPTRAYDANRGPGPRRFAARHPNRTAAVVHYLRHGGPKAATARKFDVCHGSVNNWLATIEGPFTCGQNVWYHDASVPPVPIDPPDAFDVDGEKRTLDRVERAYRRFVDRARLCPGKPTTRDEWQEVADAAVFWLAVAAALESGLVEGGPTPNVQWCRRVLDHARDRGVVPARP